MSISNDEEPYISVRLQIGTDYEAEEKKGTLEYKLENDKEKQLLNKLFEEQRGK